MYRYLIAVLLFPLLVLCGEVRSAEVTERLAEALQLRETFSVMAAEGDAYGQEVAGKMFRDDGGSSWQATVADIYAADALLPFFVTELSAELARSGADVGKILEFFESDLGRRVTTLEVSGRRALLDPSVKDAGRLKLAEMRAEADQRLGLIEDFVDINDLVDANVAGALNASFAFYLGLAEAGAFGAATDESEMLARVSAQEQAIREETDIWIHSYLIMAYAPLSDSALKDYINFSATKPARDLNRALFVAFDKVSTGVSRQLGRSAGGILVGRDL